MDIFMTIYAVCIAAVASDTMQQCERPLSHAQPADSHYRIGIAGEPDLFLPGELYTVSLQGLDNGQGPAPFIEFTIWVQNEDSVNTEPNDSSSSNGPVLPLGAFQQYDAQTKPHPFCRPAVNNATAHPKTEIRVLWNAPSNATNSCILLCAHANPAVGSGNWSVLARKICPATTVSSSFSRQPHIVEPCCACDEAKYEVVFEGLWSRNTHPRDFPPEVAQAHFGDIIGASHTGQFRVWQEGRVASNGLRKLAEDGVTTSLEKELKAESDHIRTIIKARGISWQQVARGVNPNTFAVFRVDAKHHLISLASKLAPSPDWIVGVSALELCNSNCTWSTSATLPLYPYDAGTDDGLTYTARRHPTVPAAPVRALRPDWPRDVRSPFFSSSNEMRPFARLRLTRLRLYEKICGVAAAEMNNEHGQESPASGSACITHAWGQWGPCSVTCGQGYASRQRNYVWPARAYAEACRVPLTDHKPCIGPRMHCRAISDYEADPAESTGPCAVSSWSEWSPCEGCGVRSRTRHYLLPRAFKHCNVGFRASTVMSQALPCEIGPCEKRTATYVNASVLDWFFRDETRGACKVTQWGNWSPCSERCGRGRRVRNRLYLVQARLQPLLTRILIARWRGTFAFLQNVSAPRENVTAEDLEVERLVHEHLEKCQFTLTQQESLCDGEDITCNQTITSAVCYLPLSVGPCRSYSERWFYDIETHTCEPFGFTGCGGNANNFRTRELCLRVCGNITKTYMTRTNVTHITATQSPVTQSTVTQATPTTTASSHTELSTKKNKMPSYEDNEVIQNDVPTPEVEDANCETGPWLGWSDCIGDCGFAVELNYRLVLRRASGNGKACHKLMKSRVCRPAKCQKDNTTDDSTSVHLNYEDD